MYIERERDTNTSYHISARLTCGDGWRRTQWWHASLLRLYIALILSICLNVHVAGGGGRVGGYTGIQEYRNRAYQHHYKRVVAGSIGVFFLM